MPANAHDKSGAQKLAAINADCFTCQARDRAEWCALSDKELKRLNESKNVREYLPGEVLFHQGDSCNGIYCFDAGMVGIRKIDADGNSVLLGLVYPGDTIGYRALLAGTDHLVSAEAIKPTTICFIERSTVTALLNENPALGLQFLRHAAEEVNEAEEKFLQSVTLSVRARFAHLLLILRERYSTSANEEAFSLELPLSRQDLAAMIGVRPETMSRTIRQFEDDGVAHFSGRTVHVPLVANLLDEVEPEGYM